MRDGMFIEKTNDPRMRQNLELKSGPVLVEGACDLSKDEKAGRKFQKRAPHICMI